MSRWISLFSSVDFSERARHRARLLRVARACRAAAQDFKRDGMAGDAIANIRLAEQVEEAALLGSPEAFAAAPVRFVDVEGVQ